MKRTILISTFVLTVLLLLELTCFSVAFPIIVSGLLLTGSIFLFNDKNTKLLLLTLISTIVVVQTIKVILFDSSPLLAIVDSIYYIISILLGLMFKHRDTLRKVLSVAFFIAVTLVYHYAVSPLYDVISHKNKLESQVVDHITNDIPVYDSDGTKAYLTDFTKGLTVCFFWDNREFSKTTLAEFNTICMKEDFKTYSIFCFDKDGVLGRGVSDYSYGFKYQVENGYTLPYLATAIGDSLIKTLGLVKIPQVLIIDGRNIIFRGTVNEFKNNYVKRIVNR